MVAVVAEEQVTLKEPIPERLDSAAHLPGTSVATEPDLAVHLSSVYVWLVAAVSEHAVYVM